jgi:hypothetical protein
MICAVGLKRVTAVTVGLSALVFGGSVFAGNSAARGSVAVTYQCSLADKQFIGTVSSNMTQLGFWSESLLSDDARPAVVARQARAEAAQIAATDPGDHTLRATRVLLRAMFLEYGRAVALAGRSTTAGVHMRRAWRHANEVHDLLVHARQGLAAVGCDLSPLLEA